jgi:hypothetical protein
MRYKLLNLILSSLLLTSALLPFSNPQPEPPHLGYGINIATPNWDLVAKMGFNWVKVYGPPGERLPFKILYRIEVDGPPEDLERWGEWLFEFVSTFKDTIDAYEVGNEPNLDWAWGGKLPNPKEYVEVLKVAYINIKRADPDAIVVAAGLATTGPAGFDRHPSYPKVMNDLNFLQGMYEAGAKPYFDALGSHPYGFAYEPERNPLEVNGLAFRRAEQQYEVMVAHGDGHKQIWATEWGWLLDPGQSCYDEYDWETRIWQIVSEEKQADYLVRAFQYADENWPWMGPMFIFNLDFSMVHGECDPRCWYSILNPDGSPRPAYNSLKDMEKPPPYIVLKPNSLYLLIEYEKRGIYTRTIKVENIGAGFLNWQATDDANWLEIAPTFGEQMDSLNVTIDSNGFSLNEERIGEITVSSAEASNNPQIITVRVKIVENIYEVYLPVVSAKVRIRGLSSSQRR